MISVLYGLERLCGSGIKGLHLEDLKWLDICIYAMSAGPAELSTPGRAHNYDN